jgi:hypothetical protein
MRNITGLSRLPASDYAESGCKGTKKSEKWKVKSKKSAAEGLFFIIFLYFCTINTYRL